MRREFETYLVQWRNSPVRKPLLLGGVRQCGKTYLLKDFGQRHYRQVVYLNFERERNLHSLFQKTLKPAEILQEIYFAFPHIDLNEPDTLYIFDEIQAVPLAITSLKYFAEEMPEIHLAAAGSLLGVALRREGESFPVGKVDQQILYPLSFQEFLVAKGYDSLVKALFVSKKESAIKKLLSCSELLAARLEEALSEFMMVGGMPEAVNLWLHTGDMTKVDQVHQQLIQAYQADFAKHVPNSSDVPKLTAIWQSIPTQIAKENQKFVFGHAIPGKRAADLADALQWLEDSGLVHKVFQASAPTVPLKSAVDPAKFKLFPADLGILRAQAQLPAAPLLEIVDRKNRLYGAIGECFVFTELLKAGFTPAYWTSGAKAELDFIIQSGANIIPIEVKTAANKKAKSLTSYLVTYQPKQAIKIWGRGFGVARNQVCPKTEIISLPHFFLPALKILLAKK